MKKAEAEWSAIGIIYLGPLFTPPLFDVEGMVFPGLVPIEIMRGN